MQKERRETKVYLKKHHFPSIIDEDHELESRGTIIVRKKPVVDVY